MTSNIDQLIKIVQKKGRVITHKDLIMSTRVSQYCCSCFVKEQNLLVRGEEHNPGQRGRKARLIFFDLEKGKIKGELFFVN